ncbi:MAG: DUF1385 domain-containing protein [Armatimonas sp.]
MAEARQTMYGGQAVIEGVMMRGPQHFAVAARRASGDIALTCELVPKVLRPAWQKLPLLRGAFALVDSMALGTKALFWAAKVAEEGTRTPEEIAAEAEQPKKASDMLIGGAMFTGLLFAILLFKVAPQFVVEAVKHWGHIATPWKLGLIDAAIRFTIFFGYIGLISRMSHVYRVFQYHGAEHKAINALEAGHELTVENVLAASRLHPRCGTSFLVIVILLSVLAVSPFYGLGLLWRIPIQLVMLFPVAGVSFELLRLAGKFRDNPIAAALARPGMWTQLLTTREPDASQCEVAIASLKAVLDVEEKAQK